MGQPFKRGDQIAGVAHSSAADDSDQKDENDGGILSNTVNDDVPPAGFDGGVAGSLNLDDENENVASSHDSDGTESTTNVSVVQPLTDGKWGKGIFGDDDDFFGSGGIFGTTKIFA